MDCIQRGNTKQGMYEANNANANNCHLKYYTIIYLKENTSWLKKCRNTTNQNSHCIVFTLQLLALASPENHKMAAMLPRFSIESLIVGLSAKLTWTPMCFRPAVHDRFGDDKCDKTHNRQKAFI